MSDNNEDIRIEHCEGSRRSIQQVLDACREERRPYVLIKKDLKEHSKLATILVPITMLEEEVYKAEICTYLARKTGAHIILLRANDYGITYEEQAAKGDSFHIHKELASISYNLQEKDKGGILILLTASREYGLDDWLFGPPEQYVIRHSSVPVMLVNPRADLFSLCD